MVNGSAQQTMDIFADDYAQVVRIQAMHPARPLSEIAGAAVDYLAGLPPLVRTRFIDAAAIARERGDVRKIKLSRRDRDTLNATRREHGCRANIFLGAAMTAFARASADDRDAVFLRRLQRDDAPRGNVRRRRLPHRLKEDEPCVA